MLINAILGLSVYLTLYTGMFSLANAGFMAIGAYMGVILTQNFDLPLGVGVIGGMLLAGIVAPDSRDPRPHAVQHRCCPSPQFGCTRIALALPRSSASIALRCFGNPAALRPS